MLLSLKWLREFVPYEGSAEELGATLTDLGLELENIVRPYEAIRDIVVGHVLTADPHPDSDHLSVCKVDVGQAEHLDIVCGAPNVRAGQKVPVALVGTTMPGGLVIKKAKLRGVPSFGMICSENELGFADDHSGIMVLPDTFLPGQKVIDALDLDLEVLEIGITPNRADALSVLGLARETALAYKLPLTMPKLSFTEKTSDWADDFTLDVLDAELAPLYMLRRVTNLTVQKSPDWMRYRLAAVGQRPLSNLVDVTNYILLELGQPLHAFDADRVQGNGIRVSLAKEGETLETLDGQKRILCSDDLLIRDMNRPIALAGVMGGLATEVTDTTSTVLLEGAVFAPRNIRRTSRRLGLSSESSYRFERGVDQLNTSYALDRAAALLAELGGGFVCSPKKGLEKRPWVAPKISLRRHKAVSLLGMDLSADFCADTLTRLGCEIQEIAADTAPNGATWDVTPPSWRQDLSREADLVEELIRVQGMDSLPETLPSIAKNLADAGAPLSHHDFLIKIKRWAAGLGLNEAENYSFVGQEDLDLLGLPQEGRIKIINPLSEEQNVLRTELMVSLLLNVRHNIAHNGGELNGLRLFEVAKAFMADPTSPTSAREEPRLAFALYGDLHDGWPHNDTEADYMDMRAIVEHLAKTLHLPNPSYELVQNHPCLAPSVQICLDGQKVGVIGRVKPAIAQGLYARKPLWVAELCLDTVRSAFDASTVLFKALTVYPASTRDITVRAERGITVDTVLQAISNQKLKHLESIRLVDLFEPQDKPVRNLTFRLTFRHAERTLKDSEVDKEREKLAQALGNASGMEV